MQQRGNPVRLVIALSVAAALAVFLLYTSLAGGVATPSLSPSQLAGHRGSVAVSGYVLSVMGDPHSAGGYRFHLRDINGPHQSVRVPVVYHGTAPDLFRAGRDVYVTGSFDGRRLVASSIVTKCPSKYSPAT
ncbi:MAG TPA: cytochrome c maturation protein CcmE [Gaiellaceae bacterium]